MTDALAARAIKEATLLTEQPSIVAKEPAKRVGIDDAMSVYVSNTVATKKHRTLLAYTLATSDADDMMAYAKHNQLRPLGIVFAGSRHPGCTCYAPRSWLGRCSQTLAIDQSVDAVETGLSQVSAANSFFFSCPFGKTA